MMAGDEPMSADFHIGQVAAAHFVVQQVAEQAGQAGSFINGVGKLLSWLWFWLADLGRRRAACGGREVPDPDRGPHVRAGVRWGMRSWPNGLALGLDAIS